MGWDVSRRVLVVLAWGLVLPGLAGANFASHEDPALRLLWAEGLELEQRERLVESSQRYEGIAARAPASAFIRWRISRNYWRHAERLAMDDKAGRMQYFGLSSDWADDALTVDDECGECVMWKIAALGRIATTGSVVKAASTASDIEDLIERGIALRPTHRDGPRNVTLANLYYAGAAFYRVVPDWWWLEVVIGTHGDNEKALRYIDHAIEITGSRLDYHVERGAVLLCIGSEDGDDQRIAEGRSVLRRAMDLEDFESTDSFDRAHAQVLIDQPELACSYSRDGWVDVEGGARAAQARAR